MGIPYYDWLRGDCGCGCNEGCRDMNPCDCDSILLSISKLETNDSILQDEIDELSGKVETDYYTKEEVDEKIASGGSGITIDAYTKQESDARYQPIGNYALKSEIPSLSGYATEQWVENKNYLTEHQPLKTINGQVISGTGNIVIEASGGSVTVDEHLDLNSTNPAQNKAITEALNGKLDTSAYTPTDLSNYYNKTEVDNKIASAKSEVEGDIPSLSGYATEQWVLGKNYISGVDLSNYATKQEIPTVPTSNTAFTNDAGYLTEHQSLSAYSTTEEVNNLINQSVSGKASQSDLETVSGDVNTLNSDAVTGIRITTVSAQKEAHIEQARLSGGYSNAGIIYTVGSGLTFDITNKKIAVDSSVIAQKSDLSNYYNKTDVDSLISGLTAQIAALQQRINNCCPSPTPVSPTDLRYTGTTTADTEVSLSCCTEPACEELVAHSIVETTQATGNLKTINVGECITIIGTDAFTGETNLTTVILPSTITYIRNAMLFGCTSIQNLTLLSTTPPTLSSGKLFGDNETIPSGFKINVPATAVNTYKQASGWSTYSNIIETI